MPSAADVFSILIFYILRGPVSCNLDLSGLNAKFNGIEISKVSGSIPGQVNIKTKFSILS